MSEFDSQLIKVLDKYVISYIGNNKPKKSKMPFHQKKISIQLE